MKQELLQFQQHDFVEKNDRILLPKCDNPNIFRETVKLWTCLLIKKEYKREIVFLTTDHKIPGSDDVADILVYFKDKVIPYQIYASISDELKQHIIHRDNKTGMYPKIINIDQLSREFSVAIVELRRFI